MKFFKIKIKRCKDCKYYKNLGKLHMCIKTKYYMQDDELYDGYVFRSIPLICFQKKKKDEKQ